MNPNIIVISSQGTALFHEKEYRCALGRGGVKEGKHEGDGATPVGEFPIREVYFRSDRGERPDSPFLTNEITPHDGWSDDVSDKLYNSHVTLPHKGSHETLWREDHIYDIIIVLGYNDEPSVAGKGSAIFMHIARPALTPTDGCIAFSEEDLREILSQCTIETKVRISVNK